MKTSKSAGIALLCTLLVTLAGCKKPEAPPPTPKPVARKLTLLVTSHETGHLIAKGPRLLSQWTLKEGWPEALVFSTGDMFTGEAVSTYFDGESSAEFAKALSYKASALGNQDVSLGLETLDKFRKASGVTYLAANLKEKEGGNLALHLPAYKLFEQHGIKVGVIGLTGPKTLGTNFDGQTDGFVPLKNEDALPSAIADARSGGAEAVVVLIDECFSDLATLWASHPDWKADLVVGASCPNDKVEEQVNGIAFRSVPPFLDGYVAAQLTIGVDGAHSLNAKIVSLPSNGPEDADLVTLRARWEDRVDKELGQVVGFTKSGIPSTDKSLQMLVVNALKEQAHADAAVLNKKGFRGALSKGDISKASIYSLLPFMNAVMITKIKGADLLKLKENPEAVIALPAKLAKDKDYSLATVEYLYFGGDGMGIENFALGDPELTGQVWQTPVIEWLQKLGSSKKTPLEKMLPR